MIDYRSKKGGGMPIDLLMKCVFLGELAGKHSGRIKELWLSNNWDALKFILNIHENKIENYFYTSPSDSTLNRALNNIDENILQNSVSETLQILLRSHLNEFSPIHYSMDGKSRKGVCSELTGRTEIDLTFFESSTSSIVGKITLPDKQGESTAAPILIENLFQFPQKIPNGIISFDCAMTTPDITETIIETGNDYLGSLKGFNGKVYTSISEYDWGSVEVLVETQEIHHGREEERKLKILKLSDSSENIQYQFSKYADAAIVVQVERKRLISKTNLQTEETAYYVGSSGLLDLTAKEIYKIQREHWLIENRSNYVKDVVMKEDNCFTKTHKASRNLGAIRDLVLNAAFLDGGGEIKSFLENFSSGFSKLLNEVRSLEIYQQLTNLGVSQT